MQQATCFIILLLTNVVWFCDANCDWQVTNEFTDWSYYCPVAYNTRIGLDGQVNGDQYIQATCDNWATFTTEVTNGLGFASIAMRCNGARLKVYVSQSIQTYTLTVQDVGEFEPSALSYTLTDSSFAINSRPTVFHQVENTALALRSDLLCEKDNALLQFSKTFYLNYACIPPVKFACQLESGIEHTVENVIRKTTSALISIFTKDCVPSSNIDVFAETMTGIMLKSNMFSRIGDACDIICPSSDAAPMLSLNNMIVFSMISVISMIIY